MTGLMPKPGAAFLDQRGHVTQPWRDYLRSLVAAGDVSGAIAALQAQINALQQEIADGAFLPADTQALGDMSITQDGLLQNGLVLFRLVGDESVPAATHYYGTDESGVRGFHAIPEPEAEQIFQRMDTLGDFRVTADGSLRVTN